MNGPASILFFFGAALVLHFLTARIFSSSTVILRIFQALVCGTIALAALLVYDLVYAEKSLAVVASNALVFMLAVFGYLMAFGVAATSVSVSILLRLYSGTTEIDAIEKHLYQKADLAQQRIDKLLDGGMVAREGSEYRATPRGLFFLRLLSVLKTFFKI